MSSNFELSYCLISLAILAATWFSLCSFLRRDNFRSRIRSIRDGLFDFMWKHGHNFDLSEYQHTRQMLNGLLRLSNRLGPVSFLIAMIFFAMDHSPPRSSLTDVQNLPDGELKHALLRARHQAVCELIRFVYLEGIFGLLVRLLLWALRLAKHALKAKEMVVRRAELFVQNAAADVERDPPLARCPQATI